MSAQNALRYDNLGTLHAISKTSKRLKSGHTLHAITRTATTMALPTTLAPL
ncbi:MAG: hypothetical protein LBC29_03020 [Propionibacteriaceae bacterium]|nr:hypothetical protein [Propionibacteriaceae bacterium]